MSLEEWERPGDGSRRLCWAGGDATLPVFPPFPGVGWPRDGVVEKALAAAAGDALPSLEPCVSGRLTGVTCRFAVPGATSVDRTVCVLHDERSFYVVRLDRRGRAPTGLLERAWAEALASLDLGTRLVSSVRESAEVLGFWG